MKELEIIKKWNPCKEGSTFLQSCETFKQAWDTCPRGDWMLWVSEKLNVNIKLLTTAKALCANTVRHLMRDKRSVAAIDAAILFGRGLINSEELKPAAAAAAAAEKAN